MKEKLNNELSDYLKLIRFKAKLSQEDVANKLNITRQAYGNWENNPLKLDLETLMKIGEALNENILIFFDNLYCKKQ